VDEAPIDSLDLMLVSLIAAMLFLTMLLLLQILYASLFLLELYCSAGFVELT